MIFILEGLPGCGKTSLIHRLEAVYGKELFIAPEIMPQATGDPNQFSYYVMNDLCKSESLKKLKGGLGVADRFWHSTVIYYCAANQLMTLDEFIAAYQKIYGTSLFGEYYYIFLDIASETSLKKALTHEIKSNWQDAEFVERARYLYQLTFDRLEQLNSELRGKLQVDMTTLSIDEGFAEVLHFIDRCCNHVSG